MANGHGGERKGRPGELYPQRSDMSSGDRAYGDGVNQRTVQRSTPDVTRRPATQAPPPPGSLGTLTDPSSRPTEPVTAGLSLGAGAGPEAVGNQGYSQYNKATWELRALAARFPDDPDLIRLIALAESRQ